MVYNQNDIAFAKLSVATIHCDLQPVQ